MNADKFESSLEQVRWFGNIGKALDESVPRLSTWEDWPGPEDPLVESINVRQQELYDEIVETGLNRKTSEGLFERVRDRVVILAGASVAYHPEEDAWHPPSAAVWHAAWTAGLMALCIAEGRTPPQDLRTQWAWFSSGHWPAAYSIEPEPGRESTFVIF